MSLGDVQTILWIPVEEMAKLFPAEYLKFTLEMERIGPINSYIFDWIYYELDDDISELSKDLQDNSFSPFEFSEETIKTMEETEYLFYKIYREIQAKFNAMFGVGIKIQCGVTDVVVYNEEGDTLAELFYDTEKIKWVVEASLLNKVKEINPIIVTFEY